MGIHGIFAKFSSKIFVGVLILLSKKRKPHKAALLNIDEPVII
jgi:hypothetical protein